MFCLGKVDPHLFNVVFGAVVRENCQFSIMANPGIGKAVRPHSFLMVILLPVSKVRVF